MFSDAAQDHLHNFYFIFLDLNLISFILFEANKINMFSTEHVENKKVYPLQYSIIFIYNNFGFVWNKIKKNK